MDRDRTDGVYVQLPFGLRTADGRRGLTCRGDTVGAVLEEAERDSAWRLSAASTGHFRTTVILNGLNIDDLDGLDTHVRPGDHLSLLPRPMCAAVTAATLASD
jgi:molybdopterin converting factor small subunit